MAKFTPGPWQLHKIAATSVVGSKGFVVAACGGHSNNMADPDELHDELCANARLIAAAPELLDACRKALYALKGREHDQFLRDAIAKATGAAQ
jgi:hypothetical protein